MSYLDQQFDALLKYWPDEDKTFARSGPILLIDLIQSASQQEDGKNGSLQISRNLLKNNTDFPGPKISRPFQNQFQD